jgi:hypothetical protein
MPDKLEIYGACIVGCIILLGSLLLVNRLINGSYFIKLLFPQYLHPTY